MVALGTATMPSATTSPEELDRDMLTATRMRSSGPRGRIESTESRIRAKRELAVRACGEGAWRGGWGKEGGRERGADSG